MERCCVVKENAAKDLQDLPNKLDFQVLRLASQTHQTACERELSMTDVKCIRCGALATGTSQICKICEIELNPIRPSSSSPPILVPFPVDYGRIQIRPFTGVSDILEPTIALFTRHFWLIAKITIVIVAPFEIFRALRFSDIDYDWQLSVGLYVLDLMCAVLTAPALTYALLQVMQTGVEPGINESYRWGFNKLPKLAIAAVVSWVLIGLGTMLCIIPGIVIALSLSLVFPIAILEKGSPFEVYKASHELTKGHRWKILGTTIIVVLLMGVFSVPAKLAGEYVLSQNPALWPLAAAAGIFAAILHQGTLVLSLVTYLSIRALWSQTTQ